MADLELTGPQFRPLSAALRATLNLSQFDQMLKERLDINRQDIALGDDYTEIVFKVIGDANAKGWVYQLVDAARQERPKVTAFVEYAQLIGIAPKGVPDQAQLAQLESTIRAKNLLFDIVRFRSRLGEIEGQVCRVDLDGEGEGTGFLVGPRAVLTNYHVVESVIKKERTLADLTCRFDFKVREDGTSVNKGVIVSVTEVAAHSLYDPADLHKGAQQPNAANLDYALLLLNGAPGEEPIGGKATGEPRGWMSLPQTPYAFTPQSPLFIVQHPNARPMKLALDTEAVIGLNANETRVEYRTNTEPGSSGSPCFDQNWNLVALHHSGDPNWVPTWNEGIPLPLVRSQIVMKGFERFLESS